MFLFSYPCSVVGGVNEAETGAGGAERGHQPAGEDEVETDEEGQQQE